jgi:AraC-like DNA-binding protein
LVLGFEREPRLQRKIPLSRATQVIPFLEFLDRIGVRTEPALERAKLPPRLRESPDTLIGTRAMSAFIGDVARREDVPDLGWRACSCGLAQIPALARRIRRSPTLLHALQTVCALANRESSNVQIWLVEREDSMLFCYRPSVEIGTLGADNLCLMQTRVAISLVRCFAAPDWTPTDCGVAVGVEPGPIAREELGDAKLHRAPDYGWVRLPRSILARPPRNRWPVETSAGTGAGEEPMQDLVGSLEQAVRPYLAAGAPSLRDAADLAGTSVRSLQRELACAGSSYRDVLQRAKLDAARELLEQPGVKIVEVAYETGFSDPAHFTHFFRRLAGITPRRYRATLPEG